MVEGRSAVVEREESEQDVSRHPTTNKSVQGRNRDSRAVKAALGYPSPLMRSIRMEGRNTTTASCLRRCQARFHAPLTTRPPGTTLFPWQTHVVGLSIGRISRDPGPVPRHWIGRGKRPRLATTWAGCRRKHAFSQRLAGHTSVVHPHREEPPTRFPGTSGKTLRFADPSVTITPALHALRHQA